MPVATVIDPCVQVSASQDELPVVRRPKTFLHGEGAAVGIAIFNSVGAIGGFSGPYVVGGLVDRGGYVACMQVLGGLFLLMSVLIAGREALSSPLHHPCLA